LTGAGGGVGGCVCGCGCGCVVDGKGVGVGEGVGDEDRLEEEVERQVERQVLQVEQEDLVEKDCHYDENETHVVVHGEGGCEEDDKGDEKDTKVELLDLEVVLVVTLTKHIVLNSLEDTEEGACHLENELVKGTEDRVDNEHMERGKEEVIMHYSQQHTETQASTNCY